MDTHQYCCNLVICMRRNESSGDILKDRVSTGIKKIENDMNLVTVTLHCLQDIPQREKNVGNCFCDVSISVRIHFKACFKAKCLVRWCIRGSDLRNLEFKGFKIIH